jgi:hypothetical protein
LLNTPLVLVHEQSENQSFLTEVFFCKNKLDYSLPNFSYRYLSEETIWKCQEDCYRIAYFLSVAYGKTKLRRAASTSVVLSRCLKTHFVCVPCFRLLLSTREAQLSSGCFWLFMLPPLCLLLWLLKTCQTALWPNYSHISKRLVLLTCQGDHIVKEFSCF